MCASFYTNCRFQFKVNSKQEIFEKFFMAIFIYSPFCWEVIIFSFWRLTWHLNRSLTSNKPIHYLLEYDNFIHTYSYRKKGTRSRLCKFLFGFNQKFLGYIFYIRFYLQTFVIVTALNDALLAPFSIRKISLKQFSFKVLEFFPEIHHILFSSRCLTRDLNRGFTSNKATHIP